MWLLRAATLAGYVGLASFPVLHDCTSKNLICGTSNYEKYIRSADVIKYIFEKIGGVLPYAVLLFERTGSFVVIYFAICTGASFLFVAISKVWRNSLRIFQWRKHDAIEKSTAYSSELDAIDSSVLGETDEDDTLESESFDADDTLESESCSPERNQHRKPNGIESSFRGQGKTTQEGELSLVQTQHQQQSMLATTKDSYDGSGSSIKDILRETDSGSEASLSGQLPSSEDSNHNQRTFTAAAKKDALQLNPYDADVSDQEPVLTSTDQKSHSKKVPSGHENLRVLGDVNADPAQRNSLQDSHEQLQRSTPEAPRSGTYQSLKRLHSRRRITRSELEPDIDINTTSSEEQTTDGLSENGSSRATSEVLLGVRDNDVFNASSCILSSRSLSIDKVAERKESQDSKKSEVQTQDKVIQQAMLSAADDTTSLVPGEQNVRFWQLPLYHTSATALLSCPNSSFTATPIMAADSRNSDVTLSINRARICTNTKSDNYTVLSSNAYANQCRLHMITNLEANSANDAITIQRKDMTRHIDEGLHYVISRDQRKGKKHSGVNVSCEVLKRAQRDEEKRAAICTCSLPAPQHGMYYPLDSDDVTWRVFLIQALCFIIIGRNWRKLF